MRVCKSAECVFCVSVCMNRLCVCVCVCESAEKPEMIVCNHSKERKYLIIIIMTELFAELIDN